MSAFDNEEWAVAALLGLNRSKPDAPPAPQQQEEETTMLVDTDEPREKRTSMEWSTSSSTPSTSSTSVSSSSSMSLKKPSSSTKKISSKKAKSSKKSLAKTISTKKSTVKKVPAPSKKETKPPKQPNPQGRYSPQLPSSNDVAMSPSNNKVDKQAYRDFSSVAFDEKENRLDGDIRKMSFPERVYAMLSQDDLFQIVRWQPHGRAFRICSPTKFEELVAPTYFGHSAYSAFLQQLANYGFKAITSGSDKDCYYHEMMLRGLPHLCQYIHPQKNSEQTVSDRQDEPNLNEISKKHPLPKVQKKAPTKKGVASPAFNRRKQEQTNDQKSYSASPQVKASSPAQQPQSPPQKTQGHDLSSLLASSVASAASNPSNQAAGLSQYLATLLQEQLQQQPSKQQQQQLHALLQQQQQHQYGGLDAGLSSQVLQELEQYRLAQAAAAGQLELRALLATGQISEYQILMAAEQERQRAQLEVAAYQRLLQSSSHLL